MNTKRSFLESLNTGRERRTASSLEDISRALEDIESRLERAAQTRGQGTPDKSATVGIARSMERLANEISRADAPSSREPGAHRDLARELEDSRRQEDDVALVGRIAGELKALREETVRNADRQNEEMDRRWQEFAEHMAGADGEAHPDLASLVHRLEEISAAVGRLPEALDIGSLENKVRTLAGAMEQAIAQQRLAPDITTLLDERLDEITRAIAASAPAAGVQGFDPEPFERIEARIASLARQVEELAEDRPGADIAEQLGALTRRIDDIAQRSEMPGETLDQISGQVAAIAEKLDGLAAPVDADAILGGLEQRFARLAELIESHKGETLEHSRSLVEDIQTRLGDIAGKLDRLEPQAGADTDLMAAIDTRFAELAQRLDERGGGAADAAVLKSIESRLDDIAGRIKDASTNLSGVDSELIRSLETQVASLADHLSHPESTMPEFEDLRPRLEQVERVIADNREALFEAARRAAEDAVSAVQGSHAHAADAEGLSEEIRALETVARRSDERNTRTFEAIHDTLLKIVDRLGTLEVAEEEDALGTLQVAEEDDTPATAWQEEKLALQTVPPIETGDDTQPLFDEADEADVATDRLEETGDAWDATWDATWDGDRDSAEGETRTAGQLSPSEAAAAAAEAALTDESAPSEDAARAEETARATEGKQTGQSGGKRSMLGGLTRAFTARRERESKAEERREPDLATGAASVEADDAPEVKDINEPLAPGSGAPDLNAIMKRVRDEHGPKQEAASDANTAKSDFIAAARRAAQAAAAEAEVLKKKTDTGKKPGRSGIGEILRGRRRTALMAVAGLAVIAGGFYIARGGMGDDAPRAMAEAPAASNTIADASAGDESDAVAETPARDDAVRSPDETDVARADDAGNDATGIAADGAAAPDATPSLSDAAVIAAPAPAGRDDTAEDATGAEMADPIETSSATPHDTSAARMTRAAMMGDVETASLEGGAGQDAATPIDDAAQADKAAGSDAIDLANIPVNAGPVALRDAAANGNPSAMFEIASRYTDGHGGESDMAAAARWYEKAAEQGLAPAQYRIGNLYEKGIGVEGDIDKARQWYEKAAEQGNASAMHNLGVLHAMGHDGEEADNTAAAHWFQKAAELGVKDSQFNLGILSTKGVGVPRDLVEAYKWFALVADKGDSDAAAKRDDVANALDADDLDKAKAKAELWKPKALDRAANVVEVPDEWTEGDTTTAGIDMEKAVSSIQIILNKNGYDAGPTDGVMGERTRSAIQAFQKDNDMTPSGDVDKELVQALLQNK